MTSMNQFGPEISELKASRQKRNQRLCKEWVKIGGIYSKFSQQRLTLKHGLRPTHPKGPSLNLNLLEEMYFVNVDRLNRKFPDVSKTTLSETVVAEHLSKSNIPVERHKWIGNRCVDFFLPRTGGITDIQSRRLFGFAIEVNGPIHNDAPKMFKDESLGDYLLDLSIGVLTVENTEVRSTVVVRSLTVVEKPEFTLDFRASERVRKRVYLETILHHATDSEFSDLLNSNSEVIHEAL